MTDNDHTEPTRIIHGQAEVFTAQPPTGSFTQRLVGQPFDEATRARLDDAEARGEAEHPWAATP